jgi:hypothetical protein
MLILYNSFFKKKYLINIIKINKIKYYSKLNKNELINLINTTKSIIFIQSILRKKLSKLFNDEFICPISYVDLKYPFISIKNNNIFRYYSFDAFIEYLNKSTNNFIDPFTRELLSDTCIYQIEKLIKYYKIKKSFNKKSWKKKINSRAEFLTITNCLNEILNQIFYVNSLNINFIYNNILPQFIYYFHFLLQRHKNNCFTVINNYINCINHHTCENKIYLIDYLKLIITFNNL